MQYSVISLIMTLFLSASALIVNDRGSNDSHSKCKRTEEALIYSVDKRFCGAEAEKMRTCLKNVNPNWPFLKNVKRKKKCGTPKNNPGLVDCIKSNMPKYDPNASNDFEDCIVKTGAKFASVSSSSLI